MGLAGLYGLGFGCTAGFFVWAKQFGDFGQDKLDQLGERGEFGEAGKL